MMQAGRLALPSVGLSSEHRFLQWWARLHSRQGEHGPSQCNWL